MDSDRTQEINVSDIEAHRQAIRKHVTARHVAVRRYKAALNMTLILLIVGIGITVVTRDPLAGAATGYTLALLVDLMKEGG